MTNWEYFNELSERARALLKMCSIKDAETKTGNYLQWKKAQEKFDLFARYLAEKRVGLNLEYVPIDF